MFKRFISLVMIIVVMSSWLLMGAEDPANLGEENVPVHHQVNYQAIQEELIRAIDAQRIRDEAARRDAQVLREAALTIQRARHNVQWKIVGTVCGAVVVALGIAASVIISMQRR